MTRLRQRAWTAIAVVLAIAAPAAQSELPQVLDRAEASLRRDDVAQAAPLFARALVTARESARDFDVARALLGLGEVGQRQGRAEDGRAGVLEALVIVERLGDEQQIAYAHYVLALIDRAAPNFAAAREHALRAVALYEQVEDQRGIALAALELGELQEGLPDGPGRWYERSAAAARAAGDRTLEGLALHNFGDQLFSAGRYEQSLELLTRAASAYDAAGDLGELGTVYNSIGRVYRAHGRLDEALRYQKAALDLHRKGTGQFTLLQSLNAVAVVLQRLNDLSAARVYLDEAIKIAGAMPPAPAALRAQDFLRANMAGLLADLGELAPAAAAIEQVIAGGRDSFPSIRYAQLSGVYAKMRRGHDALAAAEKAVALCDQTIDCIEAYNARSDAQAVIGDREAALRDLSLALRGIEDLRGQLVPSDAFKRDLSAYYKRGYSSAIARQLDAGLDRESLETAELARSRAFLDLLASRSIAPSTTTKLAVPLTLRGGAAASVASPVNAAAANAADLIRTAQRLRSSLLLYWVSDDETFIWVVSPDGRIRARRVKVTRTRLAALVRDTAPFVDAAGSGRGPGAPAVLRESSPAWRALYGLLIAPVRTMLPQPNGALLTIVPHDVLSNVSFAALQDARGRYLIEDFTLHYAAAGALFEFTAGVPRPHPRSGAMLIVSDPDPARRSTLDPPLPRLPGARTEATAIARQLPASRVLRLTGAAATESAVRARAPARAVLHFAAHAVVRDDEPFGSYLALSRSTVTGAGQDGDGVLTAQDVYQLKLSADLVALSACRSASGTVAGDGVAAFARAFVYAGAASVIASVWDVADQPSDRLLPAFYRAWFGGATKAAALRQAQLRLLADLRAGRVHVNTAIGPVPIPEHPVFWAGFILFGEAH